MGVAARNGDVAVLMVDVNSVNSPLAKKYGIGRLPLTLILFPNFSEAGFGGAGHGVKPTFETDSVLNRVRANWGR